MKKLMRSKSFLGVIAYGILSFMVSMGWIDASAANPWLIAAATLGGIGIVHKAQKIEDKK